jgi:hypothetical protein
MKFLLIAAAIALSTPSFAGDLGVSVNIGQPGFYGRIDIGGYPPPVLIYSEPRRVQMVPMGRPPLYLHVPDGHSRNWRKHCHAYGACGEQVYFVQNNWYQREYAPRYQQRHGGHRDYSHGGYRDAYRDDYRGHHRGHDRHDDRGRGHGNKHGHDRHDD